MRNRYSRNSAERPHQGDGGVVDHADAVPQNIAGRTGNQQRTLPNGKFGFADNAPNAAGFLKDAIVMSAAQNLKRGPLLPVEPDELALVLAERATRARL